MVQAAGLKTYGIFPETSLMADTSYVPLASSTAKSASNEGDECRQVVIFPSLVFRFNDHGIFLVRLSVSTVLKGFPSSSDLS